MQDIIVACVQQQQTPVQIVEDVYGEDVDGQPATLRKLPWTLDMVVAFAASEGRGEMGLGADPLIGGQEFEIRHVRVSVLADGRVEARFENFGQPMQTVWTFVEEDGQLRVSDVDTPHGSNRALLIPKKRNRVALDV